MAHVRFFYNGQESLQQKQAGTLLGSNYLKDSKRPYLRPLLGYGGDVRDRLMSKFFPELMKNGFRKLICHWFGINEKIQSPIPKCVKPHEVKRYKACPYCFMLFGEQVIKKEEHRIHFCTKKDFSEEQRRKMELKEDNDNDVLKNFNDKLSLLNEEQRYFYDQVLETDEGCFFLTGGAGCGKTFVLNLVIYQLRLTYGENLVEVLCPTKNAANIVEGETIHSFFGQKLIDMDIVNSELIFQQLNENPTIIENIKTKLRSVTSHILLFTYMINTYAIMI